MADNSSLKDKKAKSNKKSDTNVSNDMSTVESTIDTVTNNDNLNTESDKEVNTTENTESTESETTTDTKPTDKTDNIKNKAKSKLAKSKIYKSLKAYIDLAQNKICPKSKDEKLKNQEEIKKCLVIMAKPQNIALVLSVFAAALSLYTVNVASLSKARVFIDTQQDYVTKDVDLNTHFDKDENKKQESNSNNKVKVSNVASNLSLLSEEDIAILKDMINKRYEGYDSNTQSNSYNPKAGYTFTDRAAFVEAVEQANHDIERKQNNMILQNKFKAFENAQNSIPNNRKIYGNPNARFIIQEYSDLECPYCKEFFNIPKQVSDNSNGQVAVEWIHTPLSFHEPMATMEAVASECVFEQKGNQAFWVTLQHLYDTTGGNGSGSPILSNIPDIFNLDKKQYEVCIKSERVAKEIENLKEMASSAGVTGTPASIILDTKTGKTAHIGGYVSDVELMAAIEDLYYSDKRQKDVTNVQAQ